jgi:hypothetical protein
VIVQKLIARRLPDNCPGLEFDRNQHQFPAFPKRELPAPEQGSGSLLIRSGMGLGCGVPYREEMHRRRSVAVGVAAG